jgi:hypothetical protein
MFSKSIKFSCVLYIAACVFLSGCVPLLIGAGIVTGYLATKDTVSGNLEVSYDKLWETALSVLEEKALIVERDRQTGLIRATLNKDEIVVKMKELTETSQNLRVTARKALALANLNLAQEIFTKIVRNLENSSLTQD